MDEAMSIRAGLRNLNIWFPWFKIVATVMIAATVVFAMIGAVRRGRIEVARSESETEVVMEKETGANGEMDGEETAVKTETEAKLETETVPVEARPEDLVAQEMKGKKLIALTFDDGPAETVTPRILDILREKKAKATFFVVGRMAQAAPEILQRTEREGHAVGSHTMGHVNLTAMDVAGITQDVAAIDGVFRGTLGHATGMTRPPYGMINENVKAGVRQPLVTWTIDPKDWQTKDAAAVRGHVAGAAFDGAIVLLHDIYGTTADAVGGVIDDLREQGYEFVTVPEMAAARGVKLTAGEVYGSFRP